MSEWTQPRRADAVRNRARVLRAAEQAFAAGGAAVPLVEIARLAGVGPGTIYRHFSSKHALFDAVIRDQIQLLIADARRAAVAPDAGAAFFDFFRQMVRRLSINKAVAQALDGISGIDAQTMSELRRDFRQALAAVLAHAQAAGQVRDDVTAADAVALALGCITMVHHSGSLDRMSSLAWGALRPPGDPLPPSVTELFSAIEFRHEAPEIRNETPVARAADRNETQAASEATATADGPAARCAVCGRAIAAASTGRPARYCSAACRQKAHRRRKHTAGPARGYTRPSGAAVPPGRAAPRSEP